VCQLFRSLLVPAIGAIGNLLTIAVALGSTVALFQWGWGQPLFGIGGPAPLEYTVAILIVGVVFGLSMAAGDSLLSPTATQALIARVLAQPSIELARAPAALAGLTPREREILTLVASGLSNDDIAERLVISPATAKTHVNRTMMKLNARDRAQLVIIAYETGLITPGRQPG
jgi:DNA-binding CsgD family transcriptional regulator